MTDKTSARAKATATAEAQTTPTPDGFLESLQLVHYENIARGILDNPDTHAQRMDTFLRETCLTPELTTVVEAVDSHGKNVKWRVTKGRFTENTTQAELRLAYQEKEKGDATDPVICIIEGMNVHIVPARFFGGELMQSNGMKVTNYIEEKNREEVRAMVQEIHRDSQRVFEEEQRVHRVKHETRSRRIRRAILTLAVTGILGVSSPKIIDSWTAHNAEDHTEQVADKAAEKAAADAAAEAAAKAAAAKAEDIRVFDAAHPVLTDGETLKDGVRTPVPSTEQFDGVQTTYSYSEAPDLHGIRTIDLPTEGTCSGPMHLDIPTGESVSVAHNANPELLITATANAAADTLDVCTTNLEPSTDANAPTPPAVPGELFVTYAQK